MDIFAVTSFLNGPFADFTLLMICGFVTSQGEGILRQNSKIAKLNVAKMHLISFNRKNKKNVMNYEFCASESPKFSFSGRKIL